MKKYITRHFLLTFATILFSMDTFSQNLPNDSIMVINRRFKNEIGIDFQGFFKGTPGTSFIWKRKKVGRLISLTFSKNYRFQLAFSGTMPLTQKTTQLDTSKGYYMTKEAVQYNIQPLFGIERINFFGRFNIFYGMDFGPYYNYSKFGYSIYGYLNSSNNNNNYYYNYSYTNATGTNNSGPTEINKFGFTVAPFIGVKYRIADHFSASIESAFFLSYFYSFNKLYAYPNYYINNTNSLYANTFNIVATKTTVSGIQYNMSYLRFLTFNYHF